MTVEREHRIDRFFWALIAAAVLYLLFQIARTAVTGGTFAPSDVTPPTSFPHIVHMPTTNQIHITPSETTVPD